MITDNFKHFCGAIKDENGGLLAIDYGLRNVGLAISDHSKTIAMPLIVLQNNANLVSEICKIININKIIGIIAGWPVKLDGKSVHNIGENILFLCGNIYKITNLPVLLYDESMSTKNALNQVYGLDTKRGDKFIKKIGKGKDDHLAAQFILSVVLENLQKYH